MSPKTKKLEKPKRDMRESILAHAIRLFAARGFEATPIAAIARAVGIRKPSLLYHFPSKDELRRAVLDETLTHWNRVLPRVLAAATSGHDQFDLVVREMVSFFSADRDRARLVIREVLDRPDEVLVLLKTHVRPWIDVVANYIRRGQENGDIRPDADPEAYVVHIINLVLSSQATYDRIGFFIPYERHVAELLRLAKSGLFIAP